MAENKVIFTAEMNAEPAVNSLKQLKAELKAAQAAALNGDGKAAARVAELKDKLDDLKDATKTLQGSGVEKVSSSFNLLADGFKNFDFDKIKTGFAGVGKAMAAVPALLIAEGIMYLVQNFDELSKGSGLLAKSLRFVGDVIDTIKDGIYALTDAIGLTTSALDAMGEAATKNAEMAKDALSDQNSEFERQMAVAKAAGKSTVDIEKQKQQAIIDTNKAIINQILAYKKAGGELSDEQYKLLKSSTEAIKNAQTQLRVIDLEEQTKTNEAKKVANQKYLDELKKQQEEHNKWILEADQALAKQRADNQAQTLKEFNDLASQGVQDTIAANQDIIATGIQETQTLRDAELQSYVDRRDRINAIDLELANRQIEIASNTTKAIQGLSDLVFTLRLAKAKKAGEDEEKIAKKQFQVNKALQLGGAIVDGAKAVTASLAAAPLAIGIVPNPAGIASLAAAITTSAANIAKIATTQYQSSGGGGGGGETTLPSLNLGGGSGGSTAAPTTAAPPTAPTTGLDEQGNVIGRSGTVKAVVVETDITNSQNRIQRYNNESSF